MDVYFRDKKLERLEMDANYKGGFPPKIVRVYRRRMQWIRAADDERDLRAWKSLHLEKLRGDRAGECSIRLNRSWRLILEFEKRGDGKTVAIISIENHYECGLASYAAADSA